MDMSKPDTPHCSCLDEWWGMVRDGSNLLRLDDDGARGTALAALLAAASS